MGEFMSRGEGVVGVFTIVIGILLALGFAAGFARHPNLRTFGFAAPIVMGLIFLDAAQQLAAMRPTAPPTADAGRAMAGLRCARKNCGRPASYRVRARLYCSEHMKEKSANWLILSAGGAGLILLVAGVGGAASPAFAEAVAEAVENASRTQAR